MLLRLIKHTVLFPSLYPSLETHCLGQQTVLKKVVKGNTGTVYKGDWSCVGKPLALTPGLWDEWKKRKELRVSEGCCPSSRRRMGRAGRGGERTLSLPFPSCGAADLSRASAEHRVHTLEGCFPGLFRGARTTPEEMLEIFRCHPSPWTEVLPSCELISS